MVTDQILCEIAVVLFGQVFGLKFGPRFWFGPRFGPKFGLGPNKFGQ